MDPSLRPHGTELNLLSERWPRSDDGHLTSQNIDELRELINVGPADERPHWGDGKRLCLRSGNLRRIDGHASKFEQGKRFSILSYTLLAEQGRAAILDANNETDHQEER